MVDWQIRRRGVKDIALLEAMRRVERHCFTEEAEQDVAYEDHPLPIGHGQTLSQPYIVAYMTEQLGLTSQAKVLEIGTGCGYQTAILAELAQEVFSIEIIEPLSIEAQKRLTGMGYDNIHFKVGDGFFGWPEEAPFDACLIAAACPILPRKLIAQLTSTGRMVLPLGVWEQQLILIQPTQKGFKKKYLFAVRFVPLTGAAQKRFPH